MTSSASDSTSTGSAKVRLTSRQMPIMAHPTSGSGRSPHNGNEDERLAHLHLRTDN